MQLFSRNASQPSNKKAARTVSVRHLEVSREIPWPCPDGKLHLGNIQLPLWTFTSLDEAIDSIWNTLNLEGTLAVNATYISNEELTDNNWMDRSIPLVDALFCKDVPEGKFQSVRICPF